MQSYFLKVWSHYSVYDKTCLILLRVNNLRKKLLILHGQIRTAEPLTLITCYVMLCYVMLCYVMLCYVMLCYVMLCYVMLCYVMLIIRGYLTMLTLALLLRTTF